MYNQFHICLVHCEKNTQQQVLIYITLAYISSANGKSCQKNIRYWSPVVFCKISLAILKKGHVIGKVQSAKFINAWKNINTSQFCIQLMIYHSRYKSKDNNEKINKKQKVIWSSYEPINPLACPDCVKQWWYHPCFMTIWLVYGGSMHHSGGQCSIMDEPMVLAWWGNNMRDASILLAFCVVKLPGRQLHHTEGQ